MSMTNSKDDSSLQELYIVTLDLCHRITSISRRAIEINRVKEISQVLRAMSDDLANYEEVCTQKNCDYYKGNSKVGF